MDSFAALAEPTRRQLVTLLAAGERSFGELAEQFPISRPAVSQHLKILKTAGIVTARPDAQRRLYRLTDDALQDIENWLATVYRFWNDSLDNLERALSADQKKQQGERR